MRFVFFQIGLSTLEGGAPLCLAEKALPPFACAVGTFGHRLVWVYCVEHHLYLGEKFSWIGSFGKNKPKK